MLSSDGDEELARRLQAEEFASLGLHPQAVAAALQMHSQPPAAFSSSSSSSSSSYPRSGPASAPPPVFSYPMSQPPLIASSSLSQLQPGSVASSPRAADGPGSPHPSHRPLLALRRDNMQVRRNAMENMERQQQSSTHSGKVLCLYAAYALAEIVTSCALLSLHWHDSCNVPLNVWITLHTARWAFFLPLAVKQRVAAASASSAAAAAASGVVVDSDSRVKLWLKYVVFIWWVLGLYWLSTAQSCSSSVLFRYAVVLIVLYGVRLALPVLLLLLICLCLPCTLLLISYLQPNPGASPESISALPTRVFSRAAGAAAAAGEEGQPPQCPICMEEFKNGDVLRCLPCNATHEFHQSCCDRWLETNSTCPLCRTAISEEGREEQERERQREREQERLDREEREEQQLAAAADNDDYDAEGGGGDDARAMNRTLDVV